MMEDIFLVCAKTEIIVAHVGKMQSMIRFPKHKDIQKWILLGEIIHYDFSKYPKGSSGIKMAGLDALCI